MKDILSNHHLMPLADSRVRIAQDVEVDKEIESYPSEVATPHSYTLLYQNRPNSSESQRKSEIVSAAQRYQLLPLL